ncbi:MAG: hypothetical protein IE933_10120 [Sphingomonadales bacterium]|nr:hypothetical protein [Sphingomonadales bacterium]MBD3773313.1 hypothetical protein [Paracoccaceae bacterium]MBD3813835.1 hypothetical protein [Betaproteobacteria bacterium]
MRRLFSIIPALLLACATPMAAFAAEQAAMTEGEAADVQAALDRGLDLYNYDQAAWHTTDAMIEDVPDPAGAGIRGWVVVPVEQGWQVTYWKPDGDGFAGVYSAVWDGKKVVDRQLLSGNAARLDEAQIALVRAGRVPDLSGLQRCTDKPFNSVIMPSGKPDGSIYVYYLTPQTTLDAIPLGGHYRFEVLDGQVVGQRGFTKSCIALALRPQTKDAAKPEALVISHLLDPVPTEVHVFSMLVAHLPLYVVTSQNKTLWSIEASGGVPAMRAIERN